MSKSTIEWTEYTWNPVAGCTHRSPGCKNCCAERMANRHASNPKAPREYEQVIMDGRWNGKMAVIESSTLAPLTWKKPRVIFACSMCDLFHPSRPVEDIAWVYGAMALAHWHKFLVLTKCSARMLQLLNDADFWRGSLQIMPSIAPELSHIEAMNDMVAERLLPNVAHGVTVESPDYLWRVADLLETPSSMRFVSHEPALAGVDWRFAKSNPGIDWLICGGESGPGARPMHPDWARSDRDQCAAAGVAFLFKQWGDWAPNCLCDTKKAHRATARPTPGKMGVMFKCGKKRAGRLLDGREWNETPEWLR